MTCGSRTMKFCNDSNCMTCFNKSFASHPKSEFWAERNEITPRQIFKCSAKKAWFDCPDCNHQYESALNNVLKGKGCPYCSNKRLCEDQNCQTCFNKSFASHENAKFWSDKNTIQPRQVFKNSNYKFWFNCCHEFELSLFKINNWCPYCSGKMVCDDEECIQCFE